MATRRAAGELPLGAAAGATAPAAAVPVAVVAPGAGAPVTDAVRSICAKSSVDGVAVGVVVAGAVVAGAVGPAISEFRLARGGLGGSEVLYFFNSEVAENLLSPHNPL